MRRVRPVQPRLQRRTPIYVPHDLRTSTHVFVRRDTVRKPLQQPYDGPFRVVERRDKHFVLDLGGRTDTVSVDRLKPAHLAAAIDTRRCRRVTWATPLCRPLL